MKIFGFKIYLFSEKQLHAGDVLLKPGSKNWKNAEIQTMQI